MVGLPEASACLMSGSDPLDSAQAELAKTAANNTVNNIFFIFVPFMVFAFHESARRILYRKLRNTFKKITASP
jgi:hypothetical protein